MSRQLTQQDADREIREAFAAFDRDGNGFISADEVKTVMAQLGTLRHQDMNALPTYPALQASDFLTRKLTS
jgi:Ca2+-binding EF-hand superfamily protein